MGANAPMKQLPIESMSRYDSRLIPLLSSQYTRQMNIDAEDGHLWHDDFLNSIDGEVMISTGMGAAAKAKTPAPVAAPEIVKMAVPEQVKSSTIFAVLGGSAVVVGAAVAMWIWASSKR
jgi:hypothetical protein